MATRKRTSRVSLKARARLGSVVVGVKAGSQLEEAIRGIKEVLGPLGCPNCMSGLDRIVIEDIRVQGMR